MEQKEKLVLCLCGEGYEKKGRYLIKLFGLGKKAGQSIPQHFVYMLRPTQIFTFTKAQEGEKTTLSLSLLTVRGEVA